MATEIETKIEDFIDAAPRGGDDGMLEGTEIKTSNNFDDNWSDTSSEVSLSFLACSSSWTVWCDRTRSQISSSKLVPQPQVIEDLKRVPIVQMPPRAAIGTIQSLAGVLITMRQALRR
jgi:hypothetical protein